MELRFGTQAVAVDADGDLVTIWVDPEGLWVDDPWEPGYLQGDKLPAGWRWA